MKSTEVSRKGLMRRQLVSLAFAVMAILPAHVAAADTGPPPAGPSPSAVAPTVATQRLPPSAPRIRDEAAMVLVGTALIAIAAAVRRAA